MQSFSLFFIEFETIDGLKVAFRIGEFFFRLVVAFDYEMFAISLFLVVKYLAEFFYSIFHANLNLFILNVASFELVIFLAIVSHIDFFLSSMPIFFWLREPRLDTLKNRR